MSNTTLLEAVPGEEKQRSRVATSVPALCLAVSFAFVTGIAIFSRRADPLPATLPSSLASVPDGCFVDTGGTCFLHNCSAGRGSVACDTAWFMCLCIDGTCSGTDGVCRDPAEHPPQGGMMPKLRKEFLTLSLGTPLAATLRSDVLYPIAMSLGMSSVCGEEKEQAKKDLLQWVPGARNWRARRDQLKLDNGKAILFSMLKLVFFHLAQPVGFVLVFIIYQEFMGQVQWFAALLVLVRELMYALLASYMAFAKPAFLLYQPTRYDCLYACHLGAAIDKRSYTTYKYGGYDLMYFASPVCFLLVEYFECTSNLDKDLVDKPSNFKYGLIESAKGIQVARIECLILVSDVAAIFALVAGLSSWGVMWPALMVGYLLAVASLPLTAASIWNHRRQYKLSSALRQWADSL